MDEQSSGLEDLWDENYLVIQSWYQWISDVIISIWIQTVIPSNHLPIKKTVLMPILKCLLGTGHKGVKVSIAFVSISDLFIFFSIRY